MNPQEFIEEIENEMDMYYLESSAGQLGIIASFVALKEKRSVEDVYSE
jgi:hypothetical protein